jgi:hypothetical protein
MAWYTVERACGHEEEIQLYGPHRQREWRLENVESERLCRECWQAKVEAERNAAAEQAATEADKEGFPELQGSEKQVRWALQIRAERWAEYSALLQRLDEATPKSEKDERKKAALISGVDAVMARDDAGWWIDMRTLTPRTLLRRVIEENLMAS